MSFDPHAYLIRAFGRPEEQPAARPRTRRPPKSGPDQIADAKNIETATAILYRRVTRDYTVDTFPAYIARHDFTGSAGELLAKLTVGLNASGPSLTQALDAIGVEQAAVFIREASRYQADADVTAALMRKVTLRRKPFEPAEIRNHQTSRGALAALGNCTLRLDKILDTVELDTRKRLAIMILTGDTGHQRTSDEIAHVVHIFEHELNEDDFDQLTGSKHYMSANPLDLRVWAQPHRRGLGSDIADRWCTHPQIHIAAWALAEHPTPAARAAAARLHGPVLLLTAGAYGANLADLDLIHEHLHNPGQDRTARDNGPDPGPVRPLLVINAWAEALLDTATGTPEQTHKLLEILTSAPVHPNRGLPSKIVMGAYDNWNIGEAAAAHWARWCEPAQLGLMFARREEERPSERCVTLAAHTPGVYQHLAGRSGLAGRPELGGVAAIREYLDRQPDLPWDAFEVGIKTWTGSIAELVDTLRAIEETCTTGPR